MLTKMCSFSIKESFLSEKGSVLVWRPQSVSWKEGWRIKKVDEMIVTSENV